ncbi:MAG: SLC13 family permease [Bacteroidetes bacterium]|nr:SLC13 family permease [Bacteroidota bacterium]
MNIPLLTLSIVFLLIAVRQIGHIRIPIWLAMLGGAFVVLITGSISLNDAFHAINLDVLAFLFGMFVVGQALEESGYLAHITYHIFKRAKTIDTLLLSILFVFGFTSAVLMNDTLAIIGTPVVLLLARKHHIPPNVLLLALAFAVTTGSVCSPIGNPQNLLIALSGRFQNPFLEFLQWLLFPTILNMFITYAILKCFYHDHFHDDNLKHSQEPIRNHELAFLARISLHSIFVLIVLKIIIVALGLKAEFRLTYIALFGALPILVGSTKRWNIVKRIDWPTLIFFASMFVLMEAVWQSGFFQSVLDRLPVDIRQIPTILGVSLVLSQFISNVPSVALYQPLLLTANVSNVGLLALAAGSTIAGNALILSAASNVIIIQNAERRSHHTLTFWEFARVGIPLTIMQTLVYWGTLTLMQAWAH